MQSNTEDHRRVNRKKDYVGLAWQSNFRPNRSLGIWYTDLALIALKAKDGSADGGEGEVASSCPSSWLKEHTRFSPLPTTLMSRAAAGGGGGGGGGGSTAAVPTLAAAREAW